MIVLALDTSGVDCSACVYDSASDRVLGEVCEMIGKGHAERLMAVINGALQQAQLPLQKVERIAVTIGPGPSLASVSVLPPRAALPCRLASRPLASPRLKRSRCIIF